MAFWEQEGLWYQSYILSNLGALRGVKEKIKNWEINYANALIFVVGWITTEFIFIFFTIY